MYFSNIHFEIAYRLSTGTKVVTLNDCEWLDDRRCASSLQ